MTAADEGEGEGERTAVVPGRAGLAPDLAFVRRQLRLVLAVDCSGSMAGDKMASLNYAMRTLLPALREVAEDNPEIDVRLSVLAFATGAVWYEREPAPLAGFSWRELAAGGETDMGAALAEVARLLTPEAMPGRQLPPVVVLLSDGFPSDDFEAGIAALSHAPYGALALKVAIAIGRDADLDVLSAFIGDPQMPPLRANNAEDLVSRIRWATTAAVRAASSPTTAPSPLAALAHEAAARGFTESDILW